MNKSKSIEHWADHQERGSSIALGMVFWILKFAGLPILRVLMYPVLGYFFLTGRSSRKASQEYLHNLHYHFAKASPFLAPPSIWTSWLHFVAFGHSALDKISAWMGKMHRSEVSFPNRSLFLELVASGKGAVILGSHIGNLEMIRGLAAHTDALSIRLNVLVHTKHAAKFNDLLRAVNPAIEVELIQVSEFGADTAIVLHEKILLGELVVIVGDRTSISQSGRESIVNFLGKPAAFSDGPLILASLLKCPVYTIFCLQKNRKYTVNFDKFADRIALPRSDRKKALQQYHQQFAAILEAQCKQAPLQWFNFFDFWKLPLPADKLQRPTELLQGTSK